MLTQRVSIVAMAVAQRMAVIKGKQITHTHHKCQLPKRTYLQLAAGCIQIGWAPTYCGAHTDD